MPGMHKMAEGCLLCIHNGSVHVNFPGALMVEDEKINRMQPNSKYK